MAWSFMPDRPVYIQLAEIMRKQIISGDYAPAAQIPSVRQLAIDTAVNPNTVQRALCALEEDGLVESRGTLGRFVTSDTSVIERCRDEDAKRLITAFIDNARQMSITDDQILNMIKEELHERS